MPQSNWTNGLYPTEDWLPIKTGPQYWERRDPTIQPMQKPPIPEGVDAPWWYYPKPEWPYQPVPWGHKVLGSLSPRKLKMREDIGAPVNDGPPKPWPPYDIWPTVTYPQPAGIAHVNTRPDGVWGVAKSVQTIKVRMLPDVWLDISPHPSAWAQGKLEAAIQEVSRKRPLTLRTEDGSITIKSMRGAGWSQYQKQHKEWKRAIKARREEHHQQMLAEEIATSGGKPKPSMDLFS